MQNNPAVTFTVNTGFLALPEHSLFVVIHLPAVDSWPSHWVLHCPAFAEEMNKSRKMVMDQARAFAEQGVGVLLPDLWGTGDSPGEFSDADWMVWRRNLMQILVWLKQQGSQTVTLWGLRLGCLLAQDIQQDWQADWPHLRQLLYWQPLLNGKQAVTQFLRLRLASGLLEGAALDSQPIAAAEVPAAATEPPRRSKPETVNDLRQRFAAGEYVEVAGYRLSPSLIKQLDSLAGDAILPTVPVTWLEVKNQSQAQLSVATSRTLESWQQQNPVVNAEVHGQVVGGEAFWTTQEIASAPELITASCVALAAVESLSVPAGPPVLRLTHAEERLTSLRQPRQEHGQNRRQERAGGSVTEEAVQFFCEDSHLYGTLHLPDGEPKLGVIVIVGGPQYRVGSHRQFVHLARAMARADIAVLRFDYRGMGDSEGIFSGFTAINSDVAAAVDVFERRLPQVQKLVLWGLCDGATAAAAYAATDSRIKGLVLLNPWVRSEAGEAKAYLRHYYWQRLQQAELWQKLRQGQFNVKDSLGSFLGALRRSTAISSTDAGAAVQPNLVAQMAQGLDQFTGQVLLVLSGRDLTASEFNDALRSSRVLKRVTGQPGYRIEHLPQSAHTFSRQRWKDQVANWTIEWIQTL